MLFVVVVVGPLDFIIRVFVLLGDFRDYKSLGRVTQVLLLRFKGGFVEFLREDISCFLSIFSWFFPINLISFSDPLSISLTFKRPR